MKHIFLTLTALSLVLTACGAGGGIVGNPPTSTVVASATPGCPPNYTVMADGGCQLATQVAPATATNMPASVPNTPAPVTNGSYQTFDYTPGGEGFGKWATDVTHPNGYAQDSCGRVWQATNLENLAWVTMFCNWATSDPSPRLQWTHPTELTITDTGTVKFELWRDHGADNASNPSPYDVANVKDSPLGLGWFAQGFNAEICVNAKCQVLNGGGVFQIGFPKDFMGHYDISITVNGGQAHFWQGEKLTSVDNWPMP